MSGVIGAGVSLKNIFHEEFLYPFNLATGITEADEGKAVTVDTSAANTVKLAGDGDDIFGRLERVEDRSIEGTLVGTVALKGSLKLPKTDAAITVGASVQGSATAGKVKLLAASANTNNNVVVEVDETNDYVVVILK